MARAGARAKTGRHRATPDALAKRIGARVRALRQEAEFSFDAFVEETGLGRGYISELERGLVVPTVTALAKVAAALELTLADLVVGDSARERLFEAARHLTDHDVALVLKQAERLRGDRTAT